MTAKKDKGMEKAVFKISLDFVQNLPSSTTEGHSQYMANRRALEKCVENPAFRRDFIQHYNGFADFLRKYDFQAGDLEKFLNMDMRLLVKKIPEKR